MPSRARFNEYTDLKSGDAYDSAGPSIWLWQPWDQALGTSPFQLLLPDRQLAVPPSGRRKGDAQFADWETTQPKGAKGRWLCLAATKHTFPRSESGREEERAGAAGGEARERVAGCCCGHHRRRVQRP